MKNIITLSLILFFANSIFAQQFAMNFVLDDENNTIDLVLTNTGADYSYTQVQDINANILTGSEHFVDIASTNFSLIISGEFLNLGAAFNSTNTIVAGEEVILGTINLIPASYEVTDFVINTAVFPPIFRATFGTNTSTEYPNVGATTLPIIVKSFKVTKKESFNALEWITSSEINSAHFEVERSVNNTRWDYVGKVDAAGTSSSKIVYTFNDEFFLKNGKAYYRLKMVDKDGKFDYSDTKYVNYENSNSKDAIAISLFPNPTKDYIELQLNQDVDISGVSSLDVYDINGKLVLERTIDLKTSSMVSLGELTNGTYTAMITVGNRAPIHKKLIIID